MHGNDIFLDPDCVSMAEIGDRVRDASTKVGQLSAKTRCKELFEEIQVQLDLLAKLIGDIRQHEKEFRVRDNSRFESLNSVDNELSNVQRLIHRVEGSHGGPQLLRRARLAIAGYEKEAEECSARIGRLRTHLQASFEEAAVELRNRSRLQNSLEPARANFIPEKLKGTGEWIWSHPKFEYWVKKPTMSPADPAFTEIADASDIDDRVLLLCGVEGCGKSVLATSIDYGLRKRHKISVFFSFWTVHGQERGIDGMLRNLLWQLVLQLPDEERNNQIERLLENHKNLTDHDSLVFEIQKLGVMQQYDVFCIVDGIQESADDWNDVKHGPLAVMTRLLECNRKMHLLLIGRWSSLEMALQLWSLTIDITRDLVRNDIFKLIAFELDNCPHITDLAIREEIRKELESKPILTFLRIEFIFKELRLCSSLAELQLTLSRLPDQLDWEYHRLFTMLMVRLNGQPDNPSIGMVRSRTLLSLIIASFRPLTFTELCLAYAMTFPEQSPIDECSENLITKEDVINTCGDFITIKKDRVHLAHTSIRDFLFRPPHRWYGQDKRIAYFRLDLKSCHRALGMASLRYLQHINWKRSDWTKLPDVLSSRYPLFNYAACHVSSHLLKLNLTSEESNQMIEFCGSDDFEAWKKFMLLSESTRGQHEPLSIRFWNDFIKLWGAFKGFGC